MEQLNRSSLIFMKQINGFKMFVKKNVPNHVILDEC